MLGGFRVAVAESVVDEASWRLRKARNLVKLLALAPDRTLHREQLIDTLWPEADPAAASNNLRQALFAARRALDSIGDDGGQRVRLARDLLVLSSEGLSTDVELFELAAARAVQAPSIAAYQEAIALYGGELLPEDRFEKWAAPRREALRERRLSLLLSLAGLQLESGDHAAALAILQQLLVDEPLNEPAHRLMMRGYALTGRRQRALEQYQQLRASLRHEFEDQPDEETRRLYQDILTRRVTGDSGPARPAGPATPRPAGGHALPLQLTSFVGRDRELLDVVGLVRRHRLVTLAGPGGCGKTRLSLEAAALLAPEVPAGAWLVELAGLSDDALVANAIAAALGVESRSARPSEQAVAAHVGAAELLLLLDNCEHVVVACAQLAETLLRTCPGLRILATSREPLHSEGEIVWRVPSLRPADAARLFSERAGSATGAGDSAVEEVCRRVDGIPLAIELAAARVGVLAPAQIAARLRDSIAVLSGGRRTALSRQQTLAATLDWSHDLLDESERTLLRRLGVFAGSFELADAEAVCDGDLDVLERLLDKSLVVAEDHGSTVRYRLLDTVRHYARDQLVGAGELAETEARHRAYFLALAERLGPRSETPAARAQLARAGDDLRAALRGALGSEPDAAIRLAAALWRYWHDSGDRTEGIRWLTAALAETLTPTVPRARAQHGLSVLALRVGDHQRLAGQRRGRGGLLPLRRRRSGRGRGAPPPRHGELGVRRLRGRREVLRREPVAGPKRRGRSDGRLGDPHPRRDHRLTIRHGGRTRAGRRERRTAARAPRGRAAAAAAGGRGVRAHARPRRSPARLFLEQTFVTARRVSPAGAAAYAVCDLAKLTRDAGHPDASRALIEKSLLAFARLKDPLGRAEALRGLGNLLSAQGKHEEARAAHAEALAIHEAAHDARGIGLALIAISVAAAHAGAPADAWRAGERALAVFERSDDGPGRAAATAQLGHLAADAGRVREARDRLELAAELWRSFARRVGWIAALQLEMRELDLALGEPDSEPARLSEALEICAHIGDRGGVALCTELMTGTANAGLTPQ